ncbi:MAG: OsmC family protein [Cytophagaceae bacterium]|nr:OsmC family protein [Cytophagaceae bacterium]
MSDTYNYEVNLQWNYETKGTLSSPVLPSKIEVATPPEFPRGMEGIWSPEHLFVAAVSSCLMATFLAITSNSKNEFISLENNAIGKVEKVDGKYAVTEIRIEPKISISSSGDPDRIRHVMTMCEKTCAISNSIKTKVILSPVFKII